jgi:hypothetical protein
MAAEFHFLFRRKVSKLISARAGPGDISHLAHEAFQFARNTLHFPVCYIIEAFQINSGSGIARRQAGREGIHLLEPELFHNFSSANDTCG